MSKISVGITILFLIFISLFSCTKRSTKPGPEDLKLYLLTDLYDKPVVQNKTYISVSYENEVVKYSEKDFIEKGYVDIPKGKDVAIKISPDNGADYIFMGIAGDASENLYENYDSGEEYNFKMDSDKFFEITIKNKDDGEIKVYDFKFESGDNGYVEISRSKDETFSDTTKVEQGDGTVYIKMTELMLKKYTLRAKAIPNENCILSSWYILHGGMTDTKYDDEMIVDKTMNGYLFKANFEGEKFTTINFEAGEGGNIIITTEKDGKLVDEDTVVIETGNTQDVKISSSKFNPSYVIKAKTVALKNRQFDIWDSEYTLPAARARSTSPIDEFIIKEDMNGKTFKAYFIYASTSAITFEPTKGGSIEVSVLRKIDNVYLQKRTITSTSEADTKTLTISDSRFEAGYTITATAAKENEYYDFKGFSSGGLPVADTAGTITLDRDSKGKTYKASFEETPITIDFAAGEGGVVKVYFTTKASVTTNKVVATSGGKGSIKITKSFLDEQTIKAKAEGNVNYGFKNWSIDGNTDHSATTEIPINIDSENKHYEASFQEIFTFNFTAGANGSIEVYKVLKGSLNDKIDSITIAAGNSGSIQISKSEFDTTYSIIAIPIESTDYGFDVWSGTGVTSGDKTNPLVMTAAMNGKTITASFVKKLTFNFKAGLHGAIDVYVLKDGTELSNKRVSENNVAGEIKLAKYLFDTPYKIIARAVANADYDFNGWSDGATGGSNPLDIKTTMTGVITANFDTYGIPSSSLEVKTEDGITWYLIKSKADILFVANEIEKGTSSYPSYYANYKYKIMNDIDYGGTYHKPIGDTGGSDGKYVQFTGVINGNGKTIKNAKYGKTTSHAFTTYTGFVGYISGASAVISNLTIDSTVVIDSTAYYTGGIAGYASGGATIINCVNKANISSYNSSYTGYISGGIVGQIDGGGTTASIVYNTGNIEGYGNISMTGGISGCITTGGKIVNAYNAGKIKSSAKDVNIGGVSGRAEAGIIVNAYNTGEIVYSKNATSLYLGGVVGGFINSGGTLNNVYSTGRISSSDSTEISGNTGGILGSIAVPNTFAFANIYFINFNNLPIHGSRAGQAGALSRTDNTVASAGVSGTASWATVFSAFNAASPNVWKQVTSSVRPVINGLGEGSQ